MSQLHEMYVNSVADSGQNVQEQRINYLSLLEEEKERPFVCTLCGKRFRQACHLQQHIRTHTNERPYHCQFCDKKFKQKSQVNQHERIHTGEKPYQCQICQKAFPQAGQLYSHQKCHGINPKIGKKLEQRPKQTRRQKQKSDQPIVVSPSPIVYLMESFAGSPEQSHLYNHEFHVPAARPELTKTHNGKFFVQQKVSNTIVMTQHKEDNKPSNITVDSRTLLQPFLQQQNQELSILSKIGTVLNTDGTGNAKNIYDEYRSMKPVPHHLKDLQRLIPSESHTSDGISS